MSQHSTVAADNTDLFLFGDLVEVEGPWANMLDTLDALPEGLPQEQVDAVLQTLNAQVKSALSQLGSSGRPFPKQAILVAGEMRRLGAWSTGPVVTTAPIWS